MDMIQKRMTPLCYQEGLAGGAGANASDLVNIAAEMFVKQLLTDAFRRVRSNGMGYVQTAKFKRRLAKEEGQLTRGFIKRDGFGLLPVEQETERSRAPFGVEDLRFALSLGGSYINQNKLLTAKIFNRPLQRIENKELEVRSKASRGAMVNGHGPGINGLTNGHIPHPMMNGGPVQRMERTALDDTLDEILDFGY
jgi:transcriptional coactivator HFI1/ADA1